MKIVSFVILNPKVHRRTGTVRHTVNGIEISDLPARLEIASFEGDPGFNLIHLDSNGKEITDTYHESIDHAKLQAEWEFNVRKNEWRQE